MEMEEKHNNPKSHEPLRQDTSTSSWSELPQDLLIIVLDRLRFTDFERAKSVCSSWYSTSKHCVPKKQTIPMLVLFPEENSNNNHCMLFNPGEKEKLYKTQDLGLDFTKSICMLTYGSWFLMLDHPYTLYIMNLFTQERIDLPPLYPYIKSERKRFPLFWIDEKTKDYVVMWTVFGLYLHYTKRGDNSWKYITLSISSADMVYKNHELYILSYKNSFIIYDLSGVKPRETFRSEAIRHQFGSGTKFKLVVTLKGDVLIVERGLYHVYKVYSSRFYEKNERVDSLGDEAMLFDLGITVLANDIEGLQRNYIYFNGSNEKNTNEFRFFNLETQKMESLHKFDCPRDQVSKARWLVPSFKSH